MQAYSYRFQAVAALCTIHWDCQHLCTGPGSLPRSVTVHPTRTPSLRQCERASDSHGVSFVVICRIPDPLAWWNSFQCRPIHADSSSRHCDHAAGVPAPRPAHPDSDRDLETNLNGQGPGRCTLSGPASLCKAQSLLGT